MAFVECCVSNLSPEARRELNESPHQVRESICLDRCGTCYEDPFLIVGAELRKGESHREIVRSLDRNPKENDE